MVEGSIPAAPLPAGIGWGRTMEEDETIELARDGQIDLPTVTPYGYLLLVEGLNELRKSPDASHEIYQDTGELRDHLDHSIGRYRTNVAMVSIETVEELDERIPVVPEGDDDAN